jgi:uncharacterized membrane protein YfhO
MTNNFLSSVTKYLKAATLSQTFMPGFFFWRNIIALASLVGIWFVLLWRAFDPAHSFAIFKDNEFLIGPVLSGMSSAFRGGEWPLRLTTALGGVPIYNLAQFSSFYPFYFYPFEIFKTPLEAAISMHRITLLHVLLSSFNMFILLRVIGCSRLAAIAGASVVSYGTNSMAYAVWINITAPYAWLPLYLAGLIGVLENRKSAKYPAMAISGIVFLICASPSQPLIHAFFVSIVFTLVYFWQNKVDLLSNASISILFRLAAISLVSFLLTAPVLLPLATEFRDMIRWVGPFPPVHGLQKIPYNAFLTDQLSITELGSLLINISRKAVGGVFVGPVVLVLALFALFSRSRKWVVAAMGLIALYALVSSTGNNLGLARVNYALPLINKIREPSRFLYLFHLGLGVLVAIGLDKIRELYLGAQNLLLWRLFGLIVVTIGTVSVLIWLRYGDGKIITLMPVGFLFVLLLISFCVARASWTFRSEIIGLAWVATLIAVIATNVSWTPPPISASDYITKDCVSLDRAINRVAELDPEHNYRLVFDGNIDKQMAAMLASYKSVRTLNCYLNPAPLRQFEELYNHGPRNDNYLQILGSRYLICPSSGEVKYQGFDFLESVSGYDIYRARFALPYSYIAQKLNGSFDNISDFTNKAKDCELSEGLLFSEPNATILLAEKVSKESDYIISEIVRKKNTVKYIVLCKSPSLLIVNEFFSENWKVSVNGVRSQLLKVNGNQLGVQLLPGSQGVEFRYSPTIFKISIILASIGLILLLVLILHSLWPPWNKGALIKPQ